MASDDLLDVDAGGMTRVGVSTDDISDMSEKELWVGAIIGLEQGMFHVPYEETGITKAHVGTHGHISDLKKMREVKREVVEGEDGLSQAEEGGGGWGQ
eukprot:g19725.t1